MHNSQRHARCALSHNMFSSLRSSVVFPLAYFVPVLLQFRISVSFFIWVSVNLNLIGSRLLSILCCQHPALALVAELQSCFLPDLQCRSLVSAPKILIARRAGLLISLVCALKEPRYRYVASTWRAKHRCNKRTCAVLMHTVDFSVASDMA